MCKHASANPPSRFPGFARFSLVVLGYNHHQLVEIASNLGGLVTTMETCLGDLLMCKQVLQTDHNTPNNNVHSSVHRIYRRDYEFIVGEKEDVDKPEQIHLDR
jgi:hypothetical protein